MEATRTVLDVIQSANQTGRLLVVLSTDFANTFDSVSGNRLENCLQTNGFPHKYVTSFMRMAKGGSVQWLH
jgi:hypothetical protein